SPVGMRMKAASAGADSGTGATLLPPTSAGRRSRARAVITVSTSVFHAAHERHWPSQRRKSAPPAWQTKRLWVRATPGLRRRGDFDGSLFIQGPHHEAVVGIGV